MDDNYWTDYLVFFHFRERVNKRLIQDHIRGFAGKSRKLEHWI